MPRKGLATLKPIRLVVLDVGGTIIEDHGEVPTAMSNAFKRGGLDVSLAEIASGGEPRSAGWCAISSS